MRDSGCSREAMAGRSAALPSDASSVAVNQREKGISPKQREHRGGRKEDAERDER